MKKIFLMSALFLLFASIALFAQTSLTLEKVCTALAARPNTCGDFIQIIWRGIQIKGIKKRSGFAHLSVKSHCAEV